MKLGSYIICLFLFVNTYAIDTTLVIPNGEDVLSNTDSLSIPSLDHIFYTTKGAFPLNYNGSSLLLSSISNGQLSKNAGFISLLDTSLFSVPKTSLSYSNSRRIEEYFKLSVLTKLSSKGDFFSLNYIKNVNKVIFSNQSANEDDLNAQLDTYRKNWSNHFKYIYQRTTGQFNGGITLNDFNDSLYLLIDSQIIPVSLASSSYLYRSHAITDVFKYTLSEDSLSKHHLLGSIHFEHLYNRFLDNDPLSNYWSSFFLEASDSSNTQDSIRTVNFTPKIGYSYSNAHFVVRLNAGISVDNYSVTNVLDSDILSGNKFENIAPSSFISGAVDNGEKGKYSFRFRYYLAGYYQNDYVAKFTFPLFKKNNFVVELLSYRNQAKFSQAFYASNHFRWNNSFDKELGHQLKVEYKLNEHHRFSVTGNKVDNSIYFFSDNYSQAKKSLYAVSSEMNSVFDFKKRVFLQTNFALQYTSNEYLRPLPIFSTVTRLYYSNYLFKNSLRYTIGGNVNYQTAYYGYNYILPINAPEVQYSSLVANYPHASLFFNVQIKSAAVFVKWEHFNATFTGNTYYLQPNFPIRGDNFKLGIKWDFLN